MATPAPRGGPRPRIDFVSNGFIPGLGLADSDESGTGVTRLPRRGSVFRCQSLATRLGHDESRLSRRGDFAVRGQHRRPLPSTAHAETPVVQVQFDKRHV